MFRITVRKDADFSYSLQYKWNEDVDVWWHDIVEGMSTICPPEWLTPDDPLFMLYTR